jgi:hypothetical protein
MYMMILWNVVHYGDPLKYGGVKLIKKLCKWSTAGWTYYQTFLVLNKVEDLPETVRIRRFAYEKWVYFFEKFYVDGEEEIVMRRSGFIFFCLVDNFLQFFKVQSKFDPLMAP